MKKLRRFAIVLLTVALTALLLTACGGGGGGGGSSSGGSNKPSSTTPTNPDKPGGSGSKDDPTTPEEYPKTWADSKTKKYFLGKGISETNYYVTFNAPMYGNAHATYAISGDKSAADVEMTEDGQTSHSKCILDGSGNSIYIYYDKQSVTIEKGESAEMSDLRAFVMIPTTSNVISMTAADATYEGNDYYMESIKINARIEGQKMTGTWDYLYQNNELKYIIAPEFLYGIASQIESISANPPASFFELPKADWSSDVTRTSSYLKSNGITVQRFYFEGKSLGSNNENRNVSDIVCTVDGIKGYYSEIYPNQEPTADYMAKSGEVYHLYEQQKKYCREKYSTDYYEENIRTAGQRLDFSVISNYTSKSSGIYTEGTARYYAETFTTRTAQNGHERYTFVFDGNKLKYIIINMYKNYSGEKIAVTELTGIPNTKLLKIPEDYTEMSY